MTSQCAASAHELSDEEVLNRVRAGDRALYGVLMTRHHRHLYRVARGILQNDAETEEVLQEAHVRALSHLDQFAGRSSFSTWMTRITVNEAFTCIRRRPRHEPLEDISLPVGKKMIAFASRTPDPEQECLSKELRGILRTAMDGLPSKYRMPFRMKAVDELSVAEVADRLGITNDCAKTRLHRARALLRRHITQRSRPHSSSTQVLCLSEQ